MATQPKPAAKKSSVPSLDDLCKRFTSAVQDEEAEMKKQPKQFAPGEGVDWSCAVEDD